jgi:hypothetical protein
MPFIIDRFEDNDLAVLETDAGESLDVHRNHLPSDAREGDVLTELPKAEQHGEVRYAVDHGKTARRREEAKARWNSLPKGPEGDIEL